MMAVSSSNHTRMSTSPTKKSLLAIVSVLLSASVLLSGCQATKGWLAKRDNGSLDYQKSKKLDPIKLPAQTETASFVPLYSTPKVGVNTLELTNSAGKQYQLPKPEKTIQITSEQTAE